MASALLSHRHIFGLKADVKDHVHFVDDNLVLYPAGNNTILYNLDTKTQKFLHATEGCRGITALALSSNKRYFAVAERSNRGSVTVYDLHTLKKRKVLTTAEASSSEYVSVCFSNDNRYLLTQGGAPDWTLVLWQWEKAKALSSVKVSNANGTPISHCSFNPVDPTIVCVTGGTIFKAYRIKDGSFKQMPNLIVNDSLASTTFMCHTWLPADRVLLGTSDGRLVIYQTGQYLTTLKNSPGKKFNNCAITCLLSWGKGFIAGTAAGTVHVFEEIAGEDGDIQLENAKLEHGQTNEQLGNAESSSENTGGNDVVIDAAVAGVLVEDLILSSGKEYYRETRVLGSENQKHSIISVAISKSEETVVATTSANQILTGSLIDSSVLAQSGKTYDSELDYLSSAFHGTNSAGNFSTITGMDVCMRKPLVVTSGVDCSIRVWNYLKKATEIHKTYPDEAHSVSFHPSGLHLLVGFTDKLRLMNLLMDDIRTFKEIPIKNCRECKFSNGGHLFAAVNGNTIQVFNFFNCECIGTMRGHNGKVRSLHWTQDDGQIISSGMDGAVYQWDLKEFKREGEYVKKGCNYTCAIANLEGDAIFAVGNDRMLREIEFPASTVTKEIESTSILGQLVLSNSQRMLFAGTANPDQPGCVRSYKFPLTGDYTEYQCLASPITKIQISADDAFVFVAGEDGSFCIMEVREKDGRPIMKREKEIMSRFAEEILVTKSDLEEKNSLMAELKNKVDELTLHNEYQLRLKDMNYNEKIKEVTERFTQELEHNKNKYEMLREEKNDLEMEYEERIKLMEDKHMHELQELETSFQVKIMAEVERYQLLAHEKEMQQDQWKDQQKMLVESHEQYVREVTEDFEQKLEEDVDLKLQMGEERDELAREFNETKRQLEADIDQEIEELKEKYESKLNAEREATLRFKGENGIMKKKFSALQKDIEVQREDIKSMLEKEQELAAQIKLLEREILSLKAQIRDRDETIGEKEKRIYDLKKKNQELEKFKFVLDYKIKELKRQIEPRESEISEMKDQIKEMDQELEQYHKSNAALDDLIGELRRKLDGMQKVIMRQRQRLSDQTMRMNRFRSELEQCVKNIQHPQLLKESFSNMYKMHVPEEVKTEKFDQDIQHEYQRQKDYLEKSVKALKRRLNHDVKLHKEDNMRIMQQNMELIKEIHEYREQAAAVRMQSLGEIEQRSSPRGRTIPALEAPTEEEMRIIEQQKNEIGDLKAKINELEGKITSKRPSSREKLAPL